MSDNRIHLLEPRLANQIAAGEVIERPASVVKELVENSLDANATRLVIDIAKGGLQLIQINDDGDGILVDDLPLAVSRHATSKVRSLADLEQLTSLGFRGEALASICSVSRFSLTSCTQSQASGWAVAVAGREQTPTITPAPHPRGTTVTVSDLFFNTPARRKFLRSTQTEWQHILEVVNRIALSRYDVGIQLTHQQRTIYQLRAADNDLNKERRVQQICGAAFIKHALNFDINHAELRLWGWLGEPAQAPTQPYPQYFYVNGRIVRDKLLMHAVRQAYAEVLPPGRHPVYILYLTIDPSQVDVNVHPTKHEVRFRDSRFVHDFIFRQLHKIISAPVVMVDQQSTQASSVTYAPSAQLDFSYVNESIASYKTLPAAQATSKTPVVNLTSTDTYQVLGQIHHHYLILQTSSGLGIVNLPLAYELITYQYLQQSLAGDGIRSQPLLVPMTLAITLDEAEIIERSQAVLQQCGIDISLFAQTKLVIRAIPSLLRNTDISLLLTGLFAVLKSDLNKGDIIPLMLKTLADRRFLAEKAYTQAEVMELLAQLKNYPEIRQKAWRELNLKGIDELFHTISY